MQDLEELQPNQIQYIQQQLERFLFEVKIKLKNQQEKIEELENNIFQLQNDNKKKQKEIDGLQDAQKIFNNDIFKLWKQLNAMGKLQSDSQINSQLSLQSQQQSQILKDIHQSTLSIIQQEIQRKFYLIRENFLKKSEHLIFQKKIEEQLETLTYQLQLNLQTDNFQIRRYSYQDNQNTNFKHQTQQMNQIDFRSQTLQNQFERKGQITILDTEVQQKQI